MASSYFLDKGMDSETNSGTLNFQMLPECFPLYQPCTHCRVLLCNVLSLIHLFLCLGTKHNICSKVKSKTRVEREKIVSGRKHKNFGLKNRKKCGYVLCITSLLLFFNIYFPWYYSIKTAKHNHD